MVELTLPVPVERVYADPDLNADVGRVALRRGPLVFCAEGSDQSATLHRPCLPREPALSSRFRPDFPGGIAVVEAEARAVTEPSPTLYRSTPGAEAPSPLMSVPHYIWCNRGPNPMQVWIRE